MTACIVLGIGDVGSAVAHALFRAGEVVTVHDAAAPPHPRRGMAFTDALFDGIAALSGVMAKRARDLDDLALMQRCARAVIATSAPLADVVSLVRPGVLVDARMRKRDPPDIQRGLAPLTIGVGPGFVAGVTTDLVVESAWGADLGRVIAAGSPAPLAGEPRRLAGAGRERFVYAEATGVFRTRRSIGEHVTAGEPVAALAGHAIAAPLFGVIRGLVHDGVEVARGAKLLEVDPRDEPALVHGIGERPARIAEAIVGIVHGTKRA